ncbi:hypothetical protein BDM02DRAFT_3190748 [Thelephora ganbajun]|uniref:Uncharacterized protein n=1 Tax=Thelephora ganbajun TaxID=370292 RepID=A0ACB6Z3W0_THEGA|nr:hypothetical protein BDM02DRAFT_3190748 [Thelephora ganbajun]
MHADLFPADTPNRPAAEFLEQYAAVLQCKACGSMYNFKDARSHGTECAQSSPNSWSIEFSTPAEHDIIALVLRLLEVLELPQNSTLSSAIEALEDVRFLCLCGDPRYEGHFDFQGLLNHVISENQEYEEIKSKVLGKTWSRTTHNSAPLDTQLINDHNTYSLKSKIVRIDREQLVHGEEVGNFPTQTQRVPSRRKWDYCEVRLQLTGTEVCFGGNLGFKRYHLGAK